MHQQGNRVARTLYNLIAWDCLKKLSEINHYNKDKYSESKKDVCSSLADNAFMVLITDLLFFSSLPHSGLVGNHLSVHSFLLLKLSFSYPHSQ